MPRSFGVVFLAALIAWALLAVLAGQALANHVQCGDVISQDTTLDSDLIDCPGDGLVIGADGITLDLGGHTVDGDGVGVFCDSGIKNDPSGHGPHLSVVTMVSRSETDYSRVRPWCFFEVTDPTLRSLPCLQTELWHHGGPIHEQRDRRQRRLRQQLRHPLSDVNTFGWRGISR